MATSLTGTRQPASQPASALLDAAGHRGMGNQQKAYASKQAKEDCKEEGPCGSKSSPEQHCCCREAVDSAFGHLPDENYAKERADIEMKQAMWHEESPRKCLGASEPLL